jgi:hypothetical protein
MWELALQGMSIGSIVRIANDEWELRAGRGNRPLSKSKVYTILKRPFYTDSLCGPGRSAKATSRW